MTSGWQARPVSSSRTLRFGICWVCMPESWTSCAAAVWREARTIRREALSDICFVALSRGSRRTTCSAGMTLSTGTASATRSGDVACTVTIDRRQLSAIRDVEGFDALAAVLFDHQYRVFRAALIPGVVVRERLKSADKSLASCGPRSRQIERY